MSAGDEDDRVASVPAQARRDDGQAAVTEPVTDGTGDETGTTTETETETATGTDSDADAEPGPDADAAVPEQRTSRWGPEQRRRERELIDVIASTPPDDPARRRARDELVTLHLPLVQYLARRFRDRGEPLEDLVQVGTIGLIKAVDRFEPERGLELSTYATPTIVGEIKRHFRDKGWAIRVPRRLQELRIALGRATAELAQKTGHSPTVAELAAHLEITEDEVIEGLEGAQAYSTHSLDAQLGDGSDDGVSLADRLGADDVDLEAVEYRESLKPLLAALPSRERRILALRFFHGMTQSQIAEEVGISQMHVSRLLARSLATLREGMTQDD
ncbi:MAG: SigB/SigF/SigG family RNA polymerase sigma factor [Frankiales bacterium]|nr:SigB/SigF/SigG family RNA polymerase sigma factor [Frankiales bacterium]